MIKLKTLVLNLIIPWAVGGLSSFLTRNSMDIYKSINLPPFAPPSWLFPVVWSVLYTLMGISSYIIYEDNLKNQNKNHKSKNIYIFQLIANFLWPIVFFNFNNFFLSLILLIILLISVIYMTTEFYKTNHIAGYLQIPYIIWLLVATYLNFGIFILN